MKNSTRAEFGVYTDQLAQRNGISNVAEKFAVDPSVQQSLEDKIQESSEFLTQINNVGVQEQQGQKLGLGVGSPIASTTDTAAKDRETKDPTSLDDQGYYCRQTNFDSHISYSKLDAWAKFPDFAERIRQMITHRQTLDVICVGFNGTSRAVTSDLAANPLLQDVNIGWLQKYRDHAAPRVMNEGKVTGVVSVGAEGDYKNIDALVFDAVNNLIEPWSREDTELRVLLGRDLLADKYFPLINSDLPPTESMAADMIISQKRVGGLQAMRVPFFPAGTMMITRVDNLSRYYQEGARRRVIVDNSKRDRIENYESSNDAYVVEDYGSGCVVENISLL